MKRLIVVFGPPARVRGGGGDFFYPERYVRIDNTHLPPDEAARRIVAALEIPVAGG